MKKLCIALLFTGSLLASGPCDGNPRFSPNGLKMTCSVTQPVILDATAFDPQSHATFNIAIAASSIETGAITIEVGWYIPGGASQRQKVNLPSGGVYPQKLAASVSIPNGALIEFVQVEEFARISAAGFIQ